MCTYAFISVFIYILNKFVLLGLKVLPQKPPQTKKTVLVFQLRCRYLFISFASRNVIFYVALGYSQHQWTI